MSDYETTQRWRNITVGVFVIVALCALVFLIFKFGDLPGFVTEIRSFTIFAKFPSAPGVQKDTAVQFCGYQVGRVTQVMPPAPRLDPRTGQTYYQAMCVLSIEERYKTIPSNVDIKVITRGLGSSYIDLKVDPDKPLVPLDPNRPETVYLVNGLELEGSVGVSSEFFPEESQKKLSKLMDSLETLIKNTNDIVGDASNQKNLKATLAHLSEMAEQATRSFEDFQQFMDTANEASEDLSTVVKELRMVTEKINAGEGSAGMFINDGRLYENLLENTDELETLIQDLKNLVAEYRARGIKVKL
jgi:ABC-type transporter Mla subunit MlaD